MRLQPCRHRWAMPDSKRALLKKMMEAGSGTSAAPTPTPAQDEKVSDVAQVLALLRQSATGPADGKLVGHVKGRTEPGNVDLDNRPIVPNADGSISTVRSMSFNDGSGEVLVPTVSDDGRVMSDAEAIDTYHRTGKHLGKFDSPEAATAYAQQLHEAQAEKYGPKRLPIDDLLDESPRKPSRFDGLFDELSVER